MQEFEDVYRENAKVVMKYLLSLTKDYHLSEELTQETFYRAYKNIEEFQGRCKLSVWLCQIAKNLLADRYKSKKHRIYSELSENLSDERQPLQQIEQRENLLQLYQWIHELKEPYKEVFLLRYNEEISLKEIAELFGKSESWARVTYYRAREELKRKQKEEWNNDIM